MTDPSRPAFEALYEAHRAEVYALALRYGGGRADFAEDVTQDVFLQLMLSLDRLEARDGLGGWLYRVTTNRCLNRLRTTRFRQQVRSVLRFVIEQPEPRCLERASSEREQAGAIFALLGELPPKERVAFCAYHLDEMEQAQIGELLGHSKGYVCKLIHRAEERLRNRLCPEQLTSRWREVRS